MARGWFRLSRETRRQVIRLAAKGWSVQQIADEVALWPYTVRRMLQPFGGVIRAEMWQVSAARLSLDDRVEIRLELERGVSFRRIAVALGRSASTVSREVAANGGRDAYAPMAAHRRACELARRPKATKLAARPELCARVIEELEALWSPTQIRARLRAEFPDRPEMWVSHETIYKSIYIQGRGELRRELARCLRTGRAQRRAQGRIEQRGRIPNMIMISERPAEAVDRAIPGHWEGDLIIGKNGSSAIATLVERATRYVLLAHIKDQRAETVCEALIARVATLPEHLWRSLTWDQGKEMSQHERFTDETGIDVYFCDPRSPWQRGSNENTNGLLRQYFPKGTSLRGYTQDDLDAVAVSLNGRPRQTLGWQTPAERLNELLALH